MTESGSAAGAYREAVAEIIDARASERPYPAGAPQLTVVRVHRPETAADLGLAELVQLRAAFQATTDDELDNNLGDEENEVEAAEVVDETGTLRYRLYGWNFGCGLLFPPEGLEVVAFAAQHDMEHWSLAQRDLFAGMDRALRQPGHGFAQSLHFCWDDDSCWDEIADAEPHTVQSEPYVRQQFGLTPTAG